MLRLRQHDGEPLLLEAIPRKIVSLVPSVTENLIQFGRAPIGRTSFCIEPREEVGSIPVVGGTKTPNIARIRSLSPDLVIANREENRREDVLEIVSMGIPVWVTYPITIDETLSMMGSLAELCGGTPTAKGLLSSIRVFLDGLPPASRFEPFRFLVPIWKDPWMAAGPETYLHHLLARVGGANVIPRSRGRYPSFELEELEDLRPDTVLLPSEPYAFGESERAELRERLPQSDVRLANGEDLCWSGPRMVSALGFLRGLRDRGRT